ncbi:MAG: hypothetical protein ACKVOQ_01500 [Cyclobacteriaceae bacterium]
MKKFILLLATVAFAASVQAQVGINNNAPDAKSILDLKATDKGLLITRMTTAFRDAISSSGATPESLLVYDTDLKGFYFFQGTSWYSLSEWLKTAGSNNVSLTGNASVTGTMSAGTVSSGSITNSGSISTSNLSSSGTVSATSLSVSGFATNALVPSGSILMWSGSIASIPSGWVLCNGTNGTPDLRDRFIVGAGNSYAVSNTGGQNSVALSIGELPSHNHTFTDFTWSSQAFGNLGKFGSGAPEDSDNSAGSGTANQTSFTGSGLAH